MVATLIHAPASPWLRGLFELFLPAPLEYDDDGPQQSVRLPIDLDLLAAPEEADTDDPEAAPAQPRDADVAAPPRPPPPPPPAAPPPRSPPAPPPPSEHEEQAPPPPSPAPEKVPPPPVPPPRDDEAGTPSLPTPSPLPAGKLADPFSIVGDVGRLRAATPNVNIYIAGATLRREKHAATFSTLLGSIPQWQALLGGTGLDPLRDFDHVLLSAPQMRNPRWLVATVQFNPPPERVKQAIDRVIERDGGDAGWRRDETYPDALRVAAIGTDALRRYAVLVPDRRLLVVLPARAEDQIPSVAALPRFRAPGAAGIVVDVVNPAKAFRRLGYDIPTSLTRMRLHFVPAGDAYRVRVEAWDADAATARKTAAHLQREFEPPGILGALKRTGSSGFLSNILGGIEFRAVKNHVLGRFAIGEDKLALILDFAAGLVAASGETASASAAPSASASSSPSTAPSPSASTSAAAAKEGGGGGPSPRATARPRLRFDGRRGPRMRPRRPSRRSPSAPPSASGSSSSSSGPPPAPSASAGAAPPTKAR
ncbi:MAG: hypothetical protein AAF715_09345 [Myxococcota bacterium]